MISYDSPDGGGTKKGAGEFEFWREGDVPLRWPNRTSCSEIAVFFPSVPDSDGEGEMARSSMRSTCFSRCSYNDSKQGEQKFGNVTRRMRHASFVGL